MFRLTVALFVLVSACRAEEPKKTTPTPVGLWFAVMKVGTIEMRMAFQIEADKEGKLTGKLIAIDQNGVEVPCKSVTFTNGKLEIDIPRSFAKYTGTIDESNKKITGEFTQLNKPQAMVLERIEKLPELNRPQTPKPPYPYIVEDLNFENVSAKISLAGTLTLPKGNGPFPAVVLITGSGPQDRDETMANHKPFLVLADHLTRAGIAVLRFDDRGVAKSGGKFAGATTADFATDAYAAVKYLLGRKEIDPKRIGICGHSEGGMVAPIVAAEHPTEIGFIVMLAGPGISGGAILKLQNIESAREAKASELELKIFGEVFDDMTPLIGSDLTPDKLKVTLREKVESALKKIPDETQRKEVRKNLDGIPDGLCEPWTRFFFAHDPAPVLKKVKCPVLALNGSKDTQVRSKENLAAIDAALKAGGNKNFTVKEFANMNHLFQVCKTGAIAEYAKIEETLNPEVLKTVSEWITGLK